jgi:hypothetical protein
MPLPAELAEQRPEYQLETEVLNWAEAVDQEMCAEEAATPELKNFERIIDFLEGKQWSAKARYGRSRPVVNRLVRQFIEMVAFLTDIQPDIQVHFTDAIEGYSEIEDLMNRMLVDWAYMQDFEIELAMVVMYGLILQAPVKVQWNPFLRGGMGDAQVLALSPLDFAQIGSTGSLKEGAEVCRMRQVVTKPWLVRRFGDVAMGVQPDAETELSSTAMRPNTISSKRWQRLSPLMRNMASKLAHSNSRDSSSRYPKCVYKEFWFKDDSVWDGSESIVVGNPLCSWSYIVEPGMPKYPRGRMLALAGGKVLEDAPNPYWDGRMPFAIYRPMRVPWKFHGLGVLDPQVAIQAITNRIEGGILDVINSTVEPKLMGPQTAFSEQDKDSIDPGQPGGKLWYRNNTPSIPQFVPPPQLGAYVQPMLQELVKEMAASSGASAISQALGKKQVPGGDSMEMILASRSSNIRLFSRSLQSFLEDAGSMVVARKLQFETADKRISQYGWKGLTNNDFKPYYRHLCPVGMEPEEFVRKIGLTIQRGTLLSVERMDKLTLMSNLRKAGEIDHVTYLSFLNKQFNANLNIEQIGQRLAAEAASKAKSAIVVEQAKDQAKEQAKAQAKAHAA